MFCVLLGGGRPSGERPEWECVNTPYLLWMRHVDRDCLLLWKMIWRKVFSLRLGNLYLSLFYLPPVFRAWMAGLCSATGVPKTRYGGTENAGGVILNGGTVHYHRQPDVGSGSGNGVNGPVITGCCDPGRRRNWYSGSNYMWRDGRSVLPGWRLFALVTS